MFFFWPLNSAESAPHKNISIFYDAGLAFPLRKKMSDFLTTAFKKTQANSPCHVCCSVFPVQKFVKPHLRPHRNEDVMKSAAVECLTVMM